MIIPDSGERYLSTALYEHLRDHPGFCAGIDAWWQEPGPGTGFSTNFPFFELPNLLGSPHNSGVTAGALQVGARHAAENAAGRTIRATAKDATTVRVLHPSR